MIRHVRFDWPKTNCRPFGIPKDSTLSRVCLDTSHLEISSSPPPLDLSNHVTLPRNLPARVKRTRLTLRCAYVAHSLPRRDDLVWNRPRPTGAFTDPRFLARASRSATSSLRGFGKQKPNARVLALSFLDDRDDGDSWTARARRSRSDLSVLSVDRLRGGRFVEREVAGERIGSGEVDPRRKTARSQSAENTSTRSPSGRHLD